MNILFIKCTDQVRFQIPALLLYKNFAALELTNPESAEEETESSSFTNTGIYDEGLDCDQLPDSLIYDQDAKINMAITKKKKRTTFKANKV